jgi:pimeloyl-ACP methyl ester carboxylesterase
MAWLDAVLTGLGLHIVRLCGHSYGGWLALGYTLHTPQRVSHLALLDPTLCFAGMRLSYRLRAVPLFLPGPRAARMRAFLRWETGGASSIRTGWS